MKTFSIQTSSTIQASEHPEHQLLEDAAQRLAKELIRERPTLPADPSNTEKSLSPDQIFGELPIIHCAFRRCTWHLHFTDLPKDAGQEVNNAEVEAPFRDWADHPCDVLLRQHIVSQHSDQIAKRCIGIPQPETLVWDVYKAGIAYWQRQQIPTSGPLLDRRLFQRLAYVYNDHRIRSLMCMVCAQIKLDTGGSNSDIEYRAGTWFLTLPKGALVKNCSLQNFQAKYASFGSPLAVYGNQSQEDLPNCSFQEWSLSFHAKWLDLLPKDENVQLTEAQVGEGENLTCETLLCCPEDHQCQRPECTKQGFFCPQCRIPVCRRCRTYLCDNNVNPEAIINDNFIGYLHDFLFHLQVTWMEKTVTSPFWTGLTLFSVGAHGQDHHTRKRHKLDEAMYMSKQRVAFKGQLFSAPMDWRSVMEQINDLDKQPRIVDLPVSGEMLEKRVRVSVSAGPFG